MKWKAYWRLARFDKPVGIALLWAPTACALWLANHGRPPFIIFIIFLFGTVLMRAAGCVVNDIIDQRLDMHVQRTQNRPLTCGEITLSEALGVLVLLLLCAWLLLLQLPRSCFPYAIAALGVTLIYPFCKRVMSAPQLVLGLAFTMGIPMAYVASDSRFNHVFYTLCLINFLWIVAYDTQYAMVDKQDDLRIGIKSTAIWLGRADKGVVAILLMLVHILWFRLAMILHWNAYFYVAWLLGLVLLSTQYRLMANRDPRECFQAFLLNAWYGMLMWLGVIVGYLS